LLDELSESELGDCVGRNSHPSRASWLIHKELRWVLAWR